MDKVCTSLLARFGVLILLTVMGTAQAAPVSNDIKLDHFGYRPGDTKIAIFSANPGSTVEIRDAADTLVYRVPEDGGSIQSKGNDGAPSGDNVWWVNFSALNTAGSYRVFSSQLNGQSYDFEIRDDIYNDVVLTAMRTFYLQRCNTPKLAAYAGAYADPAACHMPDQATDPASGHTNHGALDLTGGWHDAGDYNKYVWGAVSTAILQMLRAYEDNPGVFLDGDLNIPESGNGIPDILDEIKWELDWMLKMQLPDGSVLYQMHVDGFAADAPPSVDANLRYYQNPNVESGSVFAGTLSHASRVFSAEGMTAYANTLQSAAVDAMSNMTALGGEHSSWQFYHAWFGASENVYSALNFMGKPAGVSEPDYPYFKGTDNHGVNDNKSSLSGPPPGFVPGGPNKNYSGDATPPAGAGFYNRYYRDWADQAVWTAVTWEITENSIGYQGAYVALGSYYMAEPVAQCDNDSNCSDNIFCNGFESCVSGTCVAGSDPCPGEGLATQ